jgi:replicative DNA helicase
MGRSKLSAVFVDHIGLIKPSDRQLPRQEQVADISRGLKILAKDLRIPVIAICQLNRQTESRGDSRPRLSDLRESGAIEQDADNVLLLYRESYYDRTCSSTELEVIIAKQRNGPTGIVHLYYDQTTGRMEDLTKKTPPTP